MGSWQIGASVLFCFVGIAYGAWTIDTPFEDAGTAGVAFSDSSKLRTNIEMDENLPMNTIVAKLNFDDEGGSVPAPQITSFADGKDNTELGARVEKIDADWFLIVELPQDFEKLSQKDYGFYFNTGAPGLGHLVILITRNVKDNAPVITQVESVCRINENTVVTVSESDCTFDVLDADGFVKDTQFAITSPPDSKFQIILKGQSDAKKGTAALVVDPPGLDYETSNLHILTIVASDTVGNSYTTSYVVQVGDLPDMPPVWTSTIIPQTIVEQEASTLHVSAADGDIGIQAPIGYKLDFPESASDSQYFSIDQTGEITVKEIDRDILTNNDVFRFTVTAFEVDDLASEVSATMVVIVTDINDNYPEISMAVTEVSIDEGTNQPLDFEIVVNDPDLAEFGQFKIELLDGSGNNWNDLFFVIPSAGYQTAQVTIGVKDSQKLDYEDPLMRSMTLKLVATEQKDDTRFREKDITITLKDVNDESPVFDELDYKTTVIENIAKGAVVATVRATDADFGDVVTHSLSVQQTALVIDPLTGKITVAIDNAFDYERQTSLIVQVTAKDKVGHTTYAQLVIEVDDVNDTPPNLVMPSTQPSVEENTPDGPLVAAISATDVDLDANLTFEIDWSNSYATKQGARVDSSYYINGITIATSPADPEGRATVTGSLSIDRDFLDYEAFDILALSIVVEDEKTLTEYPDARTRSAILSIKIIDLNDNQPEFTADTISATRTVAENSDSDQLIGSVTATDRDGPGFNEVTYSIIKADDLLPDFLVMIDSKKGELRVNVSQIDCDGAYGDKMKYKVIASDGDPVNDSELEITIDIIDQNDVYPVSTITQKSYEVMENSPGNFLIATLSSKDDDFTEPFHTVSYFIVSKDNPVLTNLFELDSKTGVLTVKGVSGGGVDLDRDPPGVSSYKIPIELRDNYQLGSNSPVSLSAFDDITVVLLDENDNAPTFPEVGDNGCDAGCLVCPLEDLAANTEIVLIEAIDIDEEGDNSKVTYSLLSTSKIPGGSSTSTPDDLFKIETLNSKGKITATSALLNLWGDYNIELYAEDQGVKPMNSTKTYKICVKDINDHAPAFVYPVDGKSIRLRTEQTINAPLFDINNNTLKLFSATDEDAGPNGAVTFTIVGNDFAKAYFTVENGADNTGELQLLIALQPDTLPFKLTVEASDAGIPESLSSTATIDVVVLSSGNSDPEFTGSRTWDVSFIENDDTQTDTLTQEAEDKNNLFLTPEDPLWDEIYYYLIDDGSPGLEFFDLNRETRELTLKKALDREQYPTHKFYVLASNLASRPNNVGADPDSLSQLILNVKVEDVNDNPPKFDLELFPGGVSTGDRNGKIVLTVTAEDPDENDSITYTILKDTIEADTTLEQIKDNAFLLDASKGELSLNFDVVPTMSGYLMFTVKAVDTMGDVENHSATSIVKVFVIADSNRVKFKFLNELEDVNSLKLEMMEVFTSVIGYDSAIDEVVRATDSTGSIIAGETEVTTHFIDTINNEPVANTVITGIVNNREKMVELKAGFFALEPHLELADYDSGGGDTLQSSEALLRIILIAVSVILGLLVIILFAAFVIKTRSLNRRLEALSTTKFGSVDSGLNRVGMNVPGANKRAVEGSNPVWNEDIDAYDNISQGSYDSDLIGIEENPEFNTPSTQQGHVNGAFDGGAGDADVGRRVSVNPMQDAARRASINPLSNGGTVQRNALSHQVSIDSQASDDDSVLQQANSNFSFGKKDASIPVTEL